MMPGQVRVCFYSALQSGLGGAEGRVQEGRETAGHPGRIHRDGAEGAKP